MNLRRASGAIRRLGGFYSRQSSRSLNLFPWAPAEEFSLGKSLFNVDFIEDGKNFKVMAGFQKDAINVHIVGNQLTIQGTRKDEVDETTESYHRKERSMGLLKRVLTLPGHVDQSKANASFKDGVLTVQIPKVEQAEGEGVVKIE